MTRINYSMLALLFASSACFGQDLPLKDLLLQGENWKFISEPKTITVPGAPTVQIPKPVSGHPVEMPIDGSIFGWGETNRARIEVVLSKDEETLFGVNSSDPWVWAVSVGKEKAKPPGSRYAPLMLAPGATRSDAGSITLDITGRLYVSTPIGIQVFDPAGRLSGVIAPTAAGTPDNLKWEGSNKDTLVGWVKEKKFGRKLNASGLR